MLNLRKSMLMALTAAFAMLCCSCGYDETVSSDSKTSEESSLSISEYDNEIVFSVPENTEDSMTQTAEMLENRAILLGISDYHIVQDNEEGTVSILFESGDMNVQEITEKLSSSNKITFRRGDETTTDAESGEIIPAGEILLKGSDVASAEACATYDEMTEDALEYRVLITFTEEGTQKFHDITTELAGTSEVISIWLNNTLLIAPTVAEAISTGKAYILGEKIETYDEAKELAEKINLGELPDGVQVIGD